jgi:hypothetical protein
MKLKKREGGGRREGERRKGSSHKY